MSKTRSALLYAQGIISKDRDDIVRGYTILAVNHPSRGQLTDEGKREVRSYNIALKKIADALKERE